MRGQTVSLCLNGRLVYVLEDDYHFYYPWYNTNLRGESLPKFTIKRITFDLLIEL